MSMLAFRKSGSVAPRGFLAAGGDEPEGSDIATSMSSSSSACPLVERCAEDDDSNGAEGPCPSDVLAALDFAASGGGDLAAPPLRPDGSGASPTMLD